MTGRRLQEPLHQIGRNAGYEGSVAGLMLTTEAMVTEKPEKKCRPCRRVEGVKTFIDR